MMIMMMMMMSVIVYISQLRENPKVSPSCSHQQEVPICTLYLPSVLFRSEWHSIHPIRSSKSATFSTQDLPFSCQIHKLHSRFSCWIHKRHLRFSFTSLVEPLSASGIWRCSVQATRVFQSRAAPQLLPNPMSARARLSSLPKDLLLASVRADLYLLWLPLQSVDLWAINSPLRKKCQQPYPTLSWFLPKPQ